MQKRMRELFPTAGSCTACVRLVSIPSARRLAPGTMLAPGKVEKLEKNLNPMEVAAGYTEFQDEKRKRKLGARSMTPHRPTSV